MNHASNNLGIQNDSKFTTDALSVFEHDFIRLMISEHGWSYGQVAKHLKRSRTAIFQAHKAMIRDGTINQLPLPGFEQRPDQIEGAMSDER
ncbi:hypothetical protein [Tateyamaria sp.]|uniref:hypothetical protein n=1 Tax=Tateyamaria sp. TaxID=1929288 RepID=UPI003B221A80